MQLWVRITFRLVCCAVATAVAWWIGARFLGVSLTQWDIGTAFVTAGWVAFIGFIWALILGWPVIAWIGEKFAGLATPSDKHFRVMPQFSIAEARAKQGLYREAIEEFRKGCELFPQEATPHVRIADLELEHFHDPRAAIIELTIAATKAPNEDAFVLISHRLADLHLSANNDRRVAAAVLREIQQRYPQSKHARTAAERAEKLQRPPE